MAVSRPLVFVLIASVLALAGFYAFGGAREQTSDSSPAAPAPAAPRSEAPAAPRPAPARAARPARAPAGVPSRVVRALRGGRTVVIFFFQPRAADDDATAEAVASVRGRGVAAFSVPVRRVSAYRAVTGALGVVRAPTVVVARRGGPARVLEGYLDAGSLRQEIADAR
jgi:hypothetical protein